MRYQLTNLKYRVKYAWQRLTRGYDDSQIYDLDSWLAKELGKRLLIWSAKVDSYPADIEYDDWVDMIERHGVALILYNADYEWSIAPAQDALRFCAERLPELWD